MPYREAFRRPPPGRSSASCRASPPTASTRATPCASPLSVTPPPTSRPTTPLSSSAPCSINQPMGFYTPRTVLNDARRFNLDVRPLDINLSGRGFTVEDEAPPNPATCTPLTVAHVTTDAPGAGRALRVGAGSLRHMSERALKRIEEERHHSAFESFEDFYLRTRVELS